MRIAIAGATGTVGKYVVEEAAAREHETIPIARSAGVDVVTGAGLAHLLDGVDAVIDTLNIGTQRRRGAVEFFTTTSERLLAAESAAGVGHHVVLSIVGVDRVPIGYYQGKLAQEQAVAAGAVPWTILRTTQFHEFVEKALEFIQIGPASLVPSMLSQPVAAREVAVMLVDLATREAAGRAPEFAGPERLQIVDLARRVNSARGLGRRVLALPVPGAAGRAMRNGGLLPHVDGPRGQVTFAEWLASR